MSAAVNRLSFLVGTLRHVVLLVTGALILVPFLWMISLSIKAPGEIFHASFSFWPAQFYGIENYKSPD